MMAEYNSAMFVSLYYRAFRAAVDYLTSPAKPGVQGFHQCPVELEASEVISSPRGHMAQDPNVCFGLKRHALFHERHS